MWVVYYFHAQSLCQHLLKGLLTSEIARISNHDPVNVDRYIDDFERVLEFAKENAPIYKISFYTGMSERLIKEYLSIIKDHELVADIAVTWVAAIWSYYKLSRFRRRRTCITLTAINQHISFPGVRITFSPPWKHYIYGLVRISNSYNRRQLWEGIKNVSTIFTIISLKYILI